MTMRDYIHIGSAPYEEDCVQVDPNENYVPAMRAECKRFIELIRKKLGTEPDGAELRIKREEHDFGPYLEVVCYFEEGNETAFRYALKCESEAPARWSEAA